MDVASMALLSLAMSTDAFAAAVGKGVSLQGPRWREALRTGAIFGVIEAATPIAGWLVGSVAARHVQAWSHWIAFFLLGGLGVRLIFSGLRASADAAVERPTRHSFWVLAATGFATSIDAMAVGAGLALIHVAILPIAAAIGFTTFVMVTLGVLVGRVLGAAAGKKAEVIGGLTLLGIGTAILVGRLGAG